MTSITPFLSLAVSTRKQLSICSKQVTPCCYSRIGSIPCGRKGGVDVGRKGNGQRLLVFACSTTPYVRGIGSQRVSIGNKTDGGARKGDLSQALSAMLPFVVAATAVASLVQPSTFTWVSKELYAPALGGIMLSIGIKLSLDDFALAVKRSRGSNCKGVRHVSNVLCRFYTHIVCCKAQLSSYASFLSKGDVAVSILLTSFTTIASVLLTPLLTGLLIGSVVPVDAVMMSKSILQVVLVPVALGLVLNTYAKPIVTILRPVMPFVAMICTSLCIGSPLALNQSQILSKDGLQLVLPVLAFHAVAFAIGYWILKIPAFRQREEVCRTVSLCSGMQSSTMAGLLAIQFLGGCSQAVPAACSVIAMAIMGLSLASFWGSGYRLRDLPSLLAPQTGPAVQEAQ
ncbi:hypothetical protein ES319_D08G058600v1 [Gossypium barbadense]|uniref:Sodium/metabolite cotransporter BASS3, chloroplastic n=2 Tax=Gossypium TaxID=3633 RepID=A0A5J5QBS9_GOSBA|nr:hypothetical protein ES319_D08G058600v1 [Gossypium barbadense]TYH57029.1 hypothetical protein ES332_D08G061500v1 [Gossypium tomentosum]